MSVQLVHMDPSRMAFEEIFDVVQSHLVKSKYLDKSCTRFRDLSTSCCG